MPGTLVAAVGVTKGRSLRRRAPPRRHRGRCCGPAPPDPLCLHEPGRMFRTGSDASARTDTCVDVIDWMAREGLCDRLDRLGQASAVVGFLLAVQRYGTDHYKAQRQELAQRGERRERSVGFPVLGPFTIDDDGDPIHSRVHRLTRPFQVSTLWHGLAGLRQTGHNHHRSCAGEFSGRHRAG